MIILTNQLIQIAQSTSTDQSADSDRSVNIYLIISGIYINSVRHKRSSAKSRVPKGQEEKSLRTYPCVTICMPEE